MKRSVLAATAVVLALVLAVPMGHTVAAQGTQGAQTRLRVVHASPDAPAVDVLVDNNRVFCNLPFRAVTRYVPVTPGTHNIRIVATTAAVPAVPPAAAAATPTPGPGTPTAPAVTATPRTVTPTGTPRTATPTATRATATATPQTATPTTATPTTVAPQTPTQVATAVTPQAMTPQGVTPQGITPQGITPQGVTPQAALVQPAPARQDILNVNVTLQPNAAHSLVVLGTAANVQSQVLTDDLTAPPQGQAKVRFVHASPNAPAVNVAADDQTLFSNVSFRTATDYANVPAGSVNLQVSAADTGAVVLTVPDVEFVGRVVYTVYAIGLVNGQPPLQALPAVESVAGTPVPAAGT